MKLAQLATKPQLVKIIIKDEALTKKYGEDVEFFMHDRLDMDDFMLLATVNDKDISNITKVVKKLVLDENGKKILEDGRLLPVDIMLKVIEACVNQLGNVESQIIQK